MEKNIFTNKELYSLHFDIAHKQRRLDDFEKIYNILKTHLEPKIKAQIDKNKITEYVNLYKPENIEFIKKLLHAINHIDFDKFCTDCWEQLEKFNANITSTTKEYIYVIGVNNQIGSSNSDFNISKSNFWMFMLIYSKLKKKPIDILLNVKIAIQLYGDSVEYLIVDDCSYSGSQIVNEVLYSDASETMYKFNDSYLIKNNVYDKTMFKPIQKHNIKIHLFIPYLSYIAWQKISELQLLTCFDIVLYEKYILNEFGIVLSRSDSEKFYELYSQFYKNYNPLVLIPIFFDHKIADSLSTIELILIKGQVLDNPDLKLIFVKPCDDLYDDLPKEYLKKMLYCPVPPYHSFLKILE